MPPTQPKSIAISGEGGICVSGLLQNPFGARACAVLAHGAGAGMNHPFMAAVADGLAERGLASLRYQFPYMERGSKRPDPPKVARAAVRAPWPPPLMPCPAWRSLPGANPSAAA
jgi:hypothetical protein